MKNTYLSYNEGKNTGRITPRRLCGSNTARYPGPDTDPLFYACFECPYEDCRHDINSGECPFRIEWGQRGGHLRIKKLRGQTKN